MPNLVHTSQHALMLPSFLSNFLSSFNAPVVSSETAILAFFVVLEVHRICRFPLSLRSSIFDARVLSCESVEEEEDEGRAASQRKQKNIGGRLNCE